MSKGKNNILMTIILLIFVGQVAASTVITCPMDDQMMDHSMLMTSDQADNFAPSHGEDCCAESSNCTMSGCISFALTSPLITPEVVTASQNIVVYINLALSQSLTSLYRPPILS